MRQQTRQGERKAGLSWEEHILGTQLSMLGKLTTAVLAVGLLNSTPFTPPRGAMWKIDNMVTL